MHLAKEHDLLVDLTAGLIGVVACLPQQLGADGAHLEVVAARAVELGIRITPGEQGGPGRQRRGEGRERAVLDHRSRNVVLERPAVGQAPHVEVPAEAENRRDVAGIEHFPRRGDDLPRPLPSRELGQLDLSRGQHVHGGAEIGQGGEQADPGGGRGRVHRDQDPASGLRAVSGVQHQTRLRGCVAATGADRAGDGVLELAGAVARRLPFLPALEAAGVDQCHRASTFSRRWSKVCSARVRRRPASRIRSAQAVSCRARRARSVSSSMSCQTATSVSTS